LNTQKSFIRKHITQQIPFDEYDDFRDEACKLLRAKGIHVKYHHHEVGERGQQEIETYFSTLLDTADNIVTAKYIFSTLQSRKDCTLPLCQSRCISRQAMECIFIYILTKKEKMRFIKKVNMVT
jgi:hypothetical protein